MTRIAMLKLSVPQLRALAKVLAGTTGATRPPAERIAWAVEAASGRVPAGRNCLAQAVAAEALLNRFGYPSELRIGARRAANGGLQAHAWLEREGRVLIGTFESETYTVMRGTTP